MNWSSQSGVLSKSSRAGLYEDAGAGVRILLVVCLIVGSSLAGQAQSTTATLSGRVVDESLAGIPNASVQITNQDTNALRDSATDAAGNYLIPFLPAGRYKVLVTRGGFRTKEIETLILEIGQTARLDFKMDVGAVSERVDVHTPAVLLQTEMPALGTVIDSAKILDLPLNGRNFVQLAQLIPGAQPGTPGSITVRRGRGPIGQSDSSFGTTGLSVNGVRDTANRYFLDGIELMDGDAFTYAFPPSIDSLAEFRVETNVYSAEYGAAPGAQVNLITRSGTNQIHGTLWEFNRNDALSTAYDAIARQHIPSPRLNRNQFGGNIGGPLSIPPLYKGSNETFFFFNWERGLQALGTVPRFGIVPTDNQRQGDLSGMVNARTGAPIVLKDPLHIGIVNNRIPVSALSSQAQIFLQFQARANTQAGAFNYISTPRSQVSTQQNYNGRIDHQLSPRDTIMGRYVFNDTLEKGASFWGHDERDNIARTQNLVLSHMHVFSTRLISQFRGGWNRLTESEVFGTSNDSTHDVAGKMGLPLISRRPEDYGPPSVSITGPDGSFSMYDLDRQIGPRLRRYGLGQFDETISWQKGSHALRFGAELDRRNYYFSQARNARGSFTFDGTYTGSALADFLLGYVQRANINSTPTRTNMSGWWQAYFASDEWKPGPNLTVSLGLRYDNFQRWIQDDDKIVDIYQDGVMLTKFVQPSASPFGRSLLAPDHNDFSPRIGFAWHPSFVKSGVARGGYGIYYQMEHPNANFSMIEGEQATAGGSVIGNPAGLPDVFFNNPFQQLVTSGVWNNATSIDPKERDAYIQQWNLTLQFKLPGDILLNSAYVGTKGTRLSVAFDEDGMAFNRPVDLVDPRSAGVASVNARRPNPLFQRAVEGVKSIGNSTYHALQLSAERRSSSGLSFLTSYTWSKALSGPHDQGGLIGNGGFIGTPQDYYNLHGEKSLAGFDQPQRFVETARYALPALRGIPHAGKHLLGNWNVAMILTLQSGFPAGIDYGVDTTGTGQPSRADAVAGQTPNLSADQRTWQRWFNTSAFAPAQWGHWGTSPRTGAIRLPGFANCDLSLDKKFLLSDHDRLELRTEFFNLTNHFNPAPGSVDRNIQSATFGSVGGGVHGVTTRAIQLGAKLYF